MQHFKADCGLICFYCKLNTQDFLPFAKSHRYSFCRVADDLIDNATSIAEARIWIEKLQYFLDISYEPSQAKIVAKEYVEAQFPPDTQSALLQLPTEYLSPEPFNDLLRGFEMDLAFSKLQVEGSISPIKTESDLDLYARRVAGTVAELYLELVFYHYRSSISNEEEQIFLQAGGRMGVALQYVNIARDISVDTNIGQAYLPLTWLDEEGLTLEA